jgi:hypothetical protein
MEFSIFMVPALPYYNAVFYNYGAYQRIWICPAFAITGKFNCPAHVVFVFCHAEILADVKAVGNGAARSGHRNEVRRLELLRNCGTADGEAGPPIYKKNKFFL